MTSQPLPHRYGHQCCCLLMISRSTPSRKLTFRSQPAPSLTRRPILVPKPPFFKRGGPGSRSPNPTRKILTLLECARPSVRYRQPGNAVVQPYQVINLRKSVIKDKGLLVIPRALEVSIFATHGVNHLLYRTRSFTDQICRLVCDKQT